MTQKKEVTIHNFPYEITTFINGNIIIEKSKKKAISNDIAF